MNRRVAREVVLKALFQVDLVRANPDKALAFAADGLDLRGEALEFARELFLGTLARRQEADSEIAALSKEWDVERMPVVDRNILRLGAYEILFVDDIPNEVAINEAVELAKKYGDARSSSFVNGVLGTLHRRGAP